MSTPLYASRRVPVLPLPDLTLVEKTTFGPGRHTVAFRYRDGAGRHVVVELFRGLDGAYTRGAVVAPHGMDLDYNRRRALEDRAREDLRQPDQRAALAS